MGSIRPEEVTEKEVKVDVQENLTKELDEKNVLDILLENAPVSENTPAPEQPASEQPAPPTPEQQKLPETYEEVKMFLLDTNNKISFHETNVVNIRQSIKETQEEISNVKREMEVISVKTKADVYGDPDYKNETQRSSAYKQELLDNEEYVELLNKTNILNTEIASKNNEIDHTNIYIKHLHRLYEIYKEDFVLKIHTLEHTNLK